MKKILYKSWHILKNYLKLNILKDKKLIALQSYYSDYPYQSVLYDFKLNEDSIVFDVGGYIGEYSERIYSMYNSNIYIFELFPKFHFLIKNKFQLNKKIKVFDFGLSNKDQEIFIENNGVGTSVYGKQRKGIKTNVKCASNFILDNQIKQIDLMKLNVEGAEFDILHNLITKDIVKNIKFILIQFHEIDNLSVKKRKEIQYELSKTHNKLFDYYFIWECWEIKS